MSVPLKPINTVLSTELSELFLEVETPKAWFVVVCFSLWQATDPGCWWKCSSGRRSVEPSVIPLQTGLGGGWRSKTSVALQQASATPNGSFHRKRGLRMNGSMSANSSVVKGRQKVEAIRPQTWRAGEDSLWCCVSKLSASCKLCLGISRAALCLLMTFLKEDLLTGRAGTSGLLGQREPQLPTLHANS